MSALEIPDSEFLDPGAIPDARHGGGRRPASAWDAASAGFWCCTRSAPAAWASSMPHNRSGRDARWRSRCCDEVSATRKSCAGSNTRPRCSGAFSIPASRRCTRSNRAIARRRHTSSWSWSRVRRSPTTRARSSSRLPRACACSSSWPSAVQHAHERGVIHRDLKPANVLVAEDGQPKVLDFGIARATGADVQRITIQTAHGQLMGTLAYMSPEQLRGDPVSRRPQRRLRARRAAVSPAGRAPAVRREWRAAGRKRFSMCSRARSRRSARVNKTLTGPIEQVVARAMSRDVAGRYQTAADLAADLERFLEGRRPIAAANRRFDGGPERGSLS